MFAGLIQVVFEFMHELLHETVSHFDVTVSHFIMQNDFTIYLKSQEEIWIGIYAKLKTELIWVFLVLRAS